MYLRVRIEGQGIEQFNLMSQQRHQVKKKTKNKTKKTKQKKNKNITNHISDNNREKQND